MLQNKTIVLGVTGGIAAYKTASLASALKKQHADVHVIMTKNATEFITPVTFETLTGNKCYVDTFDRNFKFDVAHISLAKAADLIMVAPATANFIAKAANGLADDMLTTVVLASTCKKMVAPAMNTAMYENPITQDNIEKLKHYGFEVVEPADGFLACGDTGKGKMPEPEYLLERILREAALEKDMTGIDVMVTAGPTQESIDPVRYITNHSSGKMGYAIAKACLYRGANVTLVTGPTSIDKPEGVEIVQVTSAQEMFDAVMSRIADVDMLFKAAAVADYTPAVTYDNKVKKSDNDLSIALNRTEDILKGISEKRSKKQVICGFSMETENMLENSKAKLAKKKLDMICANNLKVEGAGFAGDTNVVTVITKYGVKELGMMSKFDTARAIIDIAMDIYDTETVKA